MNKINELKNNKNYLFTTDLCTEILIDTGYDVQRVAMVSLNNKTIGFNYIIENGKNYSYLFIIENDNDEILKGFSIPVINVKNSHWLENLENELCKIFIEYFNEV